MLTIQDNQGNVINKISKRASDGSHRIAWDFSHFNPYPVTSESSNYNRSGALAKPGTYNASLALIKDGEVTPLDGPISFDVKAIHEGVLKGIGYEEYNAYLTEVSKLYRGVSAVEDVLSESDKMQKLMANALKKTKILPGSIEPKITKLKFDIIRIKKSISGSPSRSEVGEKNPAGINNYLYNATLGLRDSYGPTPLHRKSLEIAKKLLTELREEVTSISKIQIPEITKALKAAGAPYISGQGID